MNLIKWEMDGFCHQFPIVQKNATKPTVLGEPGKSVLILFPYYGCFFPIQFAAHGILYHMGNTCVFSSISPIMGKATKFL